MKRPIWKCWWAWLIAIILLFNSCGCIMGGCAVLLEETEEPELTVEEVVKETEPIVESVPGYEEVINLAIAENQLDKSTYDIIISYIPEFKNIVSIEQDGTHSYKIYTENGKIYLMAMFIAGEKENTVARISTNESNYKERTVLYDAMKVAVEEEENTPIQETITQAPSEEPSSADSEKTTTKNDQKTEVAEKEIEYVYTTASGSKYHTYSCHYVKSSRRELTLEQAQSRGLSPCKVCNP